MPITRPKLAKEEAKPWMVTPSYWAGSLPEWAIYWAHSQLGLVEGVQWTYQSPLAGGRSQKGGAVIDFEEHDVGIGIRVQGLYFHLSPDQVAYDIMQRAALESAGFRIIDIDEDDALRSPVYYLKEARSGIDHSRQARGVG